MLLLLACAAPSDDSSTPVESSPVETAADPLPWDWQGEDAPPGELDPAALEEALAVVLARLPEADPIRLFEVYFQLLSGATGTCPSIDASTGQIYWEGDCSSERGFVFSGWALANWGHNARDTEGRTCADLAFYYGFARITDPEGYALDAWGTASYGDCVDGDGVRSIEAAIDGDFWDPGVYDAWLAEHHPLEVYWTASEVAGARSLLLEGGYREVTDDVYAVWLDGLPFAADAACPTEPDGVVRLWDPAGGAYEVTFDGSTSCDGCGVATSAGVTLGSVCADFTGYSTWEDRPWW